MATPYFDPQTALPDASTYNFHGPFGMQVPTALGMQAAANRRETMVPFVQRAGLADALTLQKQQQQQQEFMSPEAQAARMSEYPKTLAENTQTTLNAPGKGALERGQNESKLKLLPGQTELDLADIRNKTVNAKDEPTRYAASLMASSYEAMQNAHSDLERAAIHKSIIDRYHQRYPEHPAESWMHSWDPKMMSMYQTMYNATNMTPEFFKARMEAQERTKQVGMQQAGESYRVGEQLDAAQNPERALQRAQAQLKKVTDPKARDALYQQIDAANDALAETDLSKRFEKRSPMGDMMLRLQAQSAAKQMNLNPEETQKAIDSAIPNWENARQAEKEKIMASRGVTMSYLRRKNPGMSDMEIKASAGKRGIKIIE